jgi:hypothetical protein
MRSAASRWQLSRFGRNSSSARTIRMPLPPPPCAALIISGKPMRAASRASNCGDWSAPGVTRHDGHASGLHQFLGPGLAAHLAHRCGFRADEDDAGRFHRIGEVGVLAEEAVAGMDRLRTGLPGDFEDRIAAQVRILRPRPADRPGLVGQAHMLRVGIGFRIHGDGADAELARGRMTRQAISPRLAIRIFENTYSPSQ